MRHGESVKVTSKGIEIPERSMAALRLFEHSRCYGVFVAGRPRPGDPWFGRSNENSYDTVFPNLVLSPIHPDLWATAFYQGLKIDDRPGALRDACKALEELGINLIAVDSSLSGYRHASIDGVATCQALTQSVNEDDTVRELTNVVEAKETGPDELEQHRIELLRASGRIMLAGLLRLHCALRLRGEGFLRGAIADRSYKPLYLEPGDLTAKSVFEKSLELGTRANFVELRKRIEERGGVENGALGESVEQWLESHLIPETLAKHRIDPITLRALTTLAHASIWRIRYDLDGKAVQPIEFECGAGENTHALEVVNHVEKRLPKHLARLCRQPDMDFSDATATFHRIYHFARLRFMRRRLNVHRVRVGVSYTAGQENKPCVGVLKSILNPLAENEFSLLRTWNRITSLESGIEHGTIVLDLIHTADAFGRCGPFNANELLPARVKLMEEIEGRVQAAGASVDQSTIEPTVDRVLITWPARFARDDLVDRINKATCNRFDWLAIDRGPDSGYGDPEIMKRLVSYCRGLIQVIGRDTDCRHLLRECKALKNAHPSEERGLMRRVDARWEGAYSRLPAVWDFFDERCAASDDELAEEVVHAVKRFRKWLEREKRKKRS